MMTELLALSPEILHCIFSYADERSQERLRLANRLLAKLGRPWAFRTARISVTEESWAKFQNILDDGALAGWVTKVYIDTYIPDHVRSQTHTQHTSRYVLTITRTSPTMVMRTPMTFHSPSGSLSSVSGNSLA